MIYMCNMRKEERDGELKVKHGMNTLDGEKELWLDCALFLGHVVEKWSQHERHRVMLIQRRGKRGQTEGFKASATYIRSYPLTESDSSAGGEQEGRSCDWGEGDEGSSGLSLVLWGWLWVQRRAHTHTKSRKGRENPLRHEPLAYVSPSSLILEICFSCWCFYECPFTIHAHIRRLFITLILPFPDFAALLSLAAFIPTLPGSFTPSVYYSLPPFSPPICPSVALPLSPSPGSSPSQRAVYLKKKN